MFQLAFGGVSTSALLQTSAETINEPVDPLFRDNVPSDTLLRGNGFPVSPGKCERKIWDWDKAQERLASTSKVSFSLKAVENRDWRLAKSDAKKRAKGVDPLAPESRPISEARASMAPSASAPFFLTQDGTQAGRGSILSRGSLTSPETDETLTRADKLYQNMLKAEKARKEAWKREEWEDYLNRAAKAAEKAKINAMNLEKKEEGTGKQKTSDSESDSSEAEDEEEEEDPGPLQPYPGVMKVEVEVVVLRAPGATHSDSESTEDDDHKSVSEESDKSADDDDGTDWMKELQALNEELAEPEKPEAEGFDNESLPENLLGQRIGNIHDSLDKRTALGLGGTAFFVPEVERYAFAPSLLPPPPRSEGYKVQIGIKRLKIKPRLPLEVSRGRWRDEHPYGCPVEPDFSPSIDDIRELEERVRRVELYGTISNWCNTSIKPDGLRKLPKRDDFEERLDRELGESVAWQQYIKRTRLLEVARSKRDGKEDKTKVKMKEPKAATPPKPVDPVAALLKSEKPEAEKDKEKEKEEEKEKEKRQPAVLQPKKVKKRPVKLPTLPGCGYPPPLKLPGQPHEPSWQVGQPIKPKPIETKVKKKKTKKPETPPEELEEPKPQFGRRGSFSRRYSPEVTEEQMKTTGARRGSFSAAGPGGDANMAALAAFAEKGLLSS